MDFEIYRKEVSFSFEKILMWCSPRESLLFTISPKRGRADAASPWSPEEVIIFITQEDIFGKDLAKYTFSERCAEIPELELSDGTIKLLLNMSGKNGRHG